MTGSCHVGRMGDATHEYHHGPSWCHDGSYSGLIVLWDPLSP